MTPIKMLPVLRDAVDEIEISSPCSVPWETMRGDGRVRFCGQCRQNVYNVQEISRADARRLVAEREGRVCVRILRRDDGTVVTADCWSRLRAARRRGLVPFVLIVFVIGWTELLAARFGLRALRSAVDGPRMGAPVMMPMAGEMAPAAIPPGQHPPRPSPSLPLLGKPVAPPMGHLAGRIRHK